MLYNGSAYVRTARLAAIPPLSERFLPVTFRFTKRNINIKDIQETDGTRNCKVV